MPVAPKHPCSRPGCSVLVPYGQPRCDAHTKQQLKEADDRRLSARERGYDAGWQKLRAAKASADPLCERCRTKGLVVPLDVVHHKDRDRSNRSWDNLESLCNSCHDAEHRGERFGNKDRQGKVFPDWLPSPAIPVTLVCGPPASGKTTWAHAHAQSSDIIIDLDGIKAEVSGLPIYQAGPEWIGPALYERNRRLAELSRMRSGRAYVIVSAPSMDERRKWKDLLKADRVVIIEARHHVCKDRIKSDPRRAKVYELHCGVVDDWWHKYAPCEIDTIIR